MRQTKQKENRLVVGDAEWAKDIPGWLLDEIKTERMVYGLASIAGKELGVGNTEVCACLMTASLKQPLSSEHTNIYMYLATQLFKKREKKVPEDIKKDKLTEWEEHKFEELKDMIYQKRGGEIHHPLLDVMRQLKKDIDKTAKNAKKG